MVIKSIRALFLLYAGLAMLVHMIIPHDHHLTGPVNGLKESCSMAHEKPGDHPFFPAHCNAFNDMAAVLAKAKESAESTHNHPEGIKGAQAIAACIFMARQKEKKELIKRFTEEKFGYDLNFTLDEIRADYSFDETCQGSVPQAIKAFLESDGFENTIRRAITTGGDSDTIACMAGG